MRLSVARACWWLTFAGAVSVLCVPTLSAQEAAPAAATSQTPAAPTDAQQPAPTKEQVAPAAKKANEKGKEKKKGKEKEVYTGPTEVIVLAPTPMLDEEGKQRLDPDGKPMFNPPVVQQRDKHGHPLFTPDGKPVFQTATEKGYDEHGKKIHVKKEKPPKQIPVVVSRGTFTVDGMIGKAELNYKIPDLHYIYMYAPGIGVAVISNHSFPGATLEKDAFNDNTLTIKTGEHTLQLASDHQLLGKKGHPEPAYVELDREFVLPTKYPVVGYGDTTKAPYQWPGSRPNAKLADVTTPPPVPVNLRPVMLLAPCPVGQMRQPAPPVLPGQVAPPQPCVPITKALQEEKAAASAKAAAAAKAAEAAKPAEPAPVEAPAEKPATPPRD